MIKFQPFLSSSSGNSTFVTDDETNILIDCGASGSYLEKCLQRVCSKGEELKALFLTHAHTDHIASAGVLSKKFNVPVYATKETFLLGGKFLEQVDEKNKKIISSGDDIQVGNLKIHAFPISHDIDGAVSYTVSDNETKFGIATDSGIVTDEILENLSGCETVIVESNHDIEMLSHGPYPYFLKRRILGEKGHLSNDACGELCAKLAKKGTKAFWLGHLSDHNNLPARAYESVSGVLKEKGIVVGTDVALNVIPKCWIEDRI
ncbi:MAG: MBL fold metallo-hydrolase [Clostridia bacterium]|nr:MBL fold metallo-hydrolase [Clostridia bacterium]